MSSTYRAMGYLNTVLIKFQLTQKANKEFTFDWLEHIFRQNTYVALGSYSAQIL
jgi:hypothetical protein